MMLLCELIHLGTREPMTADAGLSYGTTGHEASSNQKTTDPSHISSSLSHFLTKSRIKGYTSV
jgi:hypothetical protein